MLFVNPATHSAQNVVRVKPDPPQWVEGLASQTKDHPFRRHFVSGSGGMGLTLGRRVWLHSYQEYTLARIYTVFVQDLTSCTNHIVERA